MGEAEPAAGVPRPRVQVAEWRSGVSRQAREGQSREEGRALTLGLYSHFRNLFIIVAPRGPGPEALASAALRPAPLQRGADAGAGPGRGPRGAWAAGASGAGRWAWRRAADRCAGQVRGRRCSASGAQGGPAAPQQANRRADRRGHPGAGSSRLTDTPHLAGHRAARRTCADAPRAPCPPLVSEAAQSRGAVPRPARGALPEGYPALPGTAKNYKSRWALRGGGALGTPPLAPQGALCILGLVVFPQGAPERAGRLLGDDVQTAPVRTPPALASGGGPG